MTDNGNGRTSNGKDKRSVWVIETSRSFVEVPADHPQTKNIKTPEDIIDFVIRHSDMVFEWEREGATALLKS